MKKDILWFTSTAAFLLGNLLSATTFAQDSPADILKRKASEALQGIIQQGGAAKQAPGRTPFQGTTTSTQLAGETTAAATTPSRAEVVTNSISFDCPDPAIVNATTNTAGTTPSTASTVITPMTPTEMMLSSKYGLSGVEMRLLAKELDSKITLYTAARYRVAADAAPYANLSDAVYRQMDLVDTNGDGKPDWKRDPDLTTSNGSGFQGSVYVGIKLKEAVIAFAGTDQLVDILNDVKGGLVGDGQIGWGILLAQKALEKYPTTTDFKVLVTGHSLGGRLAQLTAAKLGISAYTFHAAAVSETDFNKLAPQKLEGIMNIWTRHDPIHPISISIGTGTAIDLGRFSCYDFGDRAGPFITNHSIGPLAESLDGIRRLYEEKIAIRAPVAPTGSTVRHSVATGYSHSCALTSNGGVKCWGNNSSGQLGDGTKVGRLVPGDVSGLTSGVVAISSGPSHTCALTSGGGVKCWGDNMNAYLGDGTRDTRTIPVDVVGLGSGVTSISAGSTGACALITSGAVLCWGFITGDGTFEIRLTPVNVVGLNSGVRAVAQGFDASCALTSSSGVKCWGLNRFGNVGDGTVADRLTPVDVVGLSSGVAAIAVGSDSVCAALNAGGAKCWGLTAGGLLPSGSMSAVPLDVPGLTNIAVAISTGGSTSCAVSSVGSVKCWGYNSNGELGDGTTDSKQTAVDVVGLGNGVVSIAVDSNHSCVSINDGTVKCWGANWDGQLGDGTTINRLTPVTVGGL